MYYYLLKVTSDKLFIFLILDFSELYEIVRKIKNLFLDCILSILLYSPT
jgi:hypothetical protein